MDKTRRKHLYEARLYRLFAIVFTFVGLFAFIMIYIQHIDGRLLKALMEPVTVFMILFPFIPAVAMSWLAKGAEKKYFAAGDMNSAKK